MSSTTISNNESICRRECDVSESHQRTSPRVGEAAQSVPAHVEDTQGLQTVHHFRVQTAEAVVWHVQLLQFAQANPVGVWEGRENEHKLAFLIANYLLRAQNEANQPYLSF